MQQASSPVLQQQLRSLHPGALQTLHQPDGTLYPHNQVIPELQNLHTSDVYQQQYALSGPQQQQPQSHAIPVHFEQHALSPSGPYQPFQAAGYHHATSPRFLNAPAPTLQEHAQQYHASPPQPVQRPIQQLPLPPAAPILTAPIPLSRHIAQGQQPQQEGHDGYVTR
jgi:glutathione S-transferase